MVYLKYWTLNLIPLMVYPYVLFHPNLSIKGREPHTLLPAWPLCSTLSSALHLKSFLLLFRGKRSSQDFDVVSNDPISAGL